MWFCGIFFFCFLFCYPLDLHASPTKRKHTPSCSGCCRGLGGEGHHDPASRWAGDWPAMGSRGMLKGTYEGVTTFTCPALGLPHLCPCHTSSNPHIHSLHPRFPPSWALRPLLLPSILSSLPHQHCCLPPRPAPTFPEGHFVWPQPRGLPPRPEVLNSPPQAVASLQPQGRSPHTRPSPLGLVSLGRPG